jgi:nucleoside phosphorylase
MLLLAIAHKGEAQEFFKRSFTQPSDFHFPGMYRDGENILLLTGEGIELAILRVSSVLTYFGNKIDRVLNMGIAGALRSTLQINQIYGIRQVYHEHQDNKKFPKLLCKETHSKTDCITAQKSVFDTKYAQSLKRVAPIVDRELWGIGFTCKNYGISFKSYKLISDYAGENTNSEAIKSKTSSYSKHLFDFYKNLSLTKESW